jgi:hypothetical protein
MGFCQSGCRDKLWRVCQGRQRAAFISKSGATARPPPPHGDSSHSSRLTASPPFLSKQVRSAERLYGVTFRDLIVRPKGSESSSVCKMLKPAADRGGEPSSEAWSRSTQARRRTRNTLGSAPFCRRRRSNHGLHFCLYLLKMQGILI